MAKNRLMNPRRTASRRDKWAPVGRSSTHKRDAVITTSTANTAIAATVNGHATSRPRNTGQEMNPEAWSQISTAAARPNRNIQNMSGRNFAKLVNFRFRGIQCGVSMQAVLP